MKFNVHVPTVVWVVHEVEAENADDAICRTEAVKFSLELYAGNGALNRLCGVARGRLELGEPDYDRIEVWVGDEFMEREMGGVS